MRKSFLAIGLGVLAGTLAIFLGSYLFENIFIKKSGSITNLSGQTLLWIPVIYFLGTGSGVLISALVNRELKLKNGLIIASVFFLVTLLSMPEQDQPLWLKVLSASVFYPAAWIFSKIIKTIKQNN